MKKTVYDISECSDSKEVYGSRPTPAVTVFVYVVVLLFVGAIVYAFFGTIEIVATAGGIVRPNDNVSNVAGMMSGKVKEIYITDGAYVKEGDVLLVLDTSEKEGVLSACEGKLEELRFDLECQNRFLSGIRTGVNPFLNDTRSDEYYYHVSFERYMLNTRDLSQQEEYTGKKNTLSRTGLESSLKESLTKYLYLAAYNESVRDGRTAVMGRSAFDTMAKGIAEGLENELFQEKLFSSELLGSAGDTAYTLYKDQYELYLEGKKSADLEKEESLRQLSADTTYDKNALYTSIYQTDRDRYETVLCALNGDIDEDELALDPQAELLYSGIVYEQEEYTRNTKSAWASLEDYKLTTLGKYKSTLSEYSSKLEELKIAKTSILSRTDMQNDLNDVYNTARNQKYYQMVTSTENEIRTIKSERDALQIKRRMYSDTLSENPGMEPTPEMKASMDSLDSQISDYNRQLSGLEALLDSLKSGYNKASDFPEYERRYFLYRSELEALSADYIQKKKQIEADRSEENNEFAIKLYTELYNGYDILVSSIEEGESLFRDEKKYSLMWVLYSAYEVEKNEYERKAKSAEAAEKAYKDSVRSEYSGKIIELDRKLDELQIASGAAISVEELTLSVIQRYDNNLETMYLKTLTSTQDGLGSLKERFLSDAGNRALLALEGEREDLSSASYTNETQLTLLNERKTLENKINELEEQIKQTKLEIEYGTIRASGSGTVNCIKELAKGDIISAGTVVATIIPPREGSAKVVLYVENTDIGNIEEGDRVRYNIAALPGSEFGEVTGTITRVSEDVTQNEGQYSGYYLVEGSLEQDILTDSEGNRDKIALGMQLEARIITKEITIIRYLLDKLGL